jgi:hypothetical protein
MKQSVGRIKRAINAKNNSDSAPVIIELLKTTQDNNLETQFQNRINFYKSLQKK